jgi:hypothetical protein
MATGISVTAKGPFFERPTAKVQKAVEHGMEKIALQGQAWVQEQLYPGHGVRTGYFRRSVTPDVPAWNKATIGSIVIYGSWLEEGPHGRQRAGSFTGYHMFRNAGDRIERLDIGAEIGKLIVEALT